MQESRGAGRLCKEALGSINATAVPAKELFELPEKILQFGTGVLLRGLPDYYIDQANKQGIFNGRIVIVKSTPQNSADDFKEQDGLYTLCLRGWQNGEATSKDIINSSVSRVIDSTTDWNAVLQTAASPDMKIVFSNTTEVGIVLDKTDLLKNGVTPRSFPGKLLAFLLERFERFEGDPEKGMIIVPAELITDNGSTLRKICLELAKINQLSQPFIHWLENNNAFCDSLVDRIVSGRMQPDEEQKQLDRLGYTDRLMIMSEVYGLWAIQTADPKTTAALSFQQVDPGVIVTASIEKYRHLKLFLLNAPHTFTCIIAQALGFQFVNEAMSDQLFEAFIRGLLMDEAVPAVSGPDITIEEAKAFAGQVLDRFKNPYIDHRWSDISKQMTLKMGMRCLPLISDYYIKFNRLPVRMIQGVAAYFLFLMCQNSDRDEAGGVQRSSLNGKDFPLTDAKAAILAAYWRHENRNPAEVIGQILNDNRLWPAAVVSELSNIGGLATAIAAAMKAMDFGKQIKI